MTSLWQCSKCETIYTFQEFMALSHVQAVPEETEPEKKHGFLPVCSKCGKPFGKDVWNLHTKKDNYVVCTDHLELGHGSVHIDPNDTKMDYWYETMIFDMSKKRKVLGHEIPDSLAFQIRYHTREEATQGHWFTVEHLNDILLSPDKYPQSIITRFFNTLDATEAQRKTYDSRTQEASK